jgi:hypothetical protein
MYKALVDEALDRGLHVASDYEVTEQASRMYEAFARRGYEVVTQPYHIEERNGRRIVIKDDEDYLTRPFQIFRKPAEEESASSKPVWATWASAVPSRRLKVLERELGHAPTEAEIKAYANRLLSDTPFATPEPAKPTFSTEARDKLFDMIDDKKPVKGVLQLARELGVSHDEASALIDHMVEYGWLHYVEKPNGDVDLRAVPVKDRPVRPMRGGGVVEARAAQEPFAFTGMPAKDFAERLKSDPAGLRALADADPMVRESLDPEIQDRLAAIDRALGIRYSLRDDNERTSRVSGALARAGAGEVRRQAGAQRIGYPAGGPHQPSEKPFVFPGYRAHFEEVAPVYDGYGNVWRARRYSVYGEGRDPVATMLVSQASDGRGHVDWVKAKGLGAKFYQAVADHFGVNIRPSGILFEDGYKFWLRHDPEAVKHHIQDELGDYHSPSDILISLRRAQKDDHPVSIDLYQKLWDKLSPEAQASANPNETMFSLRDQPLAIPHPDPLREASAIKVRDAIDKAAKMLPEGVQWKVMDSLRDPRAKWANALWDPHERLIEIADNLRNPDENAAHEAIHAARSLKIITQAEWNILSKAAREKGWVERIDAAEYAKRYGGNQDALLEEAIAHEFGRRYSETGKPKTAVEMIWARLKNFFDSIRNWMDGNGFKSANDVFEAVRRGDLADRPVAGEVRGGGYSQGDLIKMMKDNNRAPEKDPALMGEARARAAEGLANCMVR